jgi:DNA-directed RNA polymerase specialized sigma24 family protein
VKLESALFYRPRIGVENFEAAAMPHLPELYRSASLVLQNASEAEDLVQEVYFEA